MGWHDCQYLSEEEAKRLGLRYAALTASSGDVEFRDTQTNIRYQAPDMLLLYVEIGWVPPKPFVDAVMNDTLKAVDRIETRSLGPSFSSVADYPGVTLIGYLDPATTPIPKPFGVSNRLPKNFLEKLHKVMNLPGYLLKPEPAYRGSAPS